MNEPRTRCRRYLCAKHCLDGEEFCSALCLAVAHEVATAEDIVRRVGPGNVTAKLWAAAATLNDTVTEIAHLRTLLHNHLTNPRQEPAE